MYMCHVRSFPYMLATGAMARRQESKANFCFSFSPFSVILFFLLHMHVHPAHVSITWDVYVRASARTLILTHVVATGEFFFKACGRPWRHYRATKQGQALSLRPLSRTLSWHQQCHGACVPRRRERLASIDGYAHRLFWTFSNSLSRPSSAHWLVETA